jgi:anaerobic selenocysteine-containing dehydrogenase
MDRRHFIKLTAITGTSAALTACGNPEHQLIRFIPEDDFVPGVATWKPSICPLCNAGCGVIARVMDDDAEVFRNGQPGVMRMALAKKLEGNPEDPISQGKLCARGQAAIQVTYHPDRLDKPRKRSGERGSGQYIDISWDEAIQELVGQLNALATAGDHASLAFLTAPRRSRRLELIARLLQQFSAPPPVTHEWFTDEILRRANLVSFGVRQLPTYDLAQSNYLLGLGADLFGTWNSTVAHSAAYGRMRQGRVGARGKFVHVDARLSQTAANADEFVAARPGTEGVLALGLAHVVMANRLRPATAAGRAGAAIEGWVDGLKAYAPDAVSKKTGVPAATIERLAREMAAHGPAVTVIGGAPLAHSNGMVNALAVNALNALVGSVNQPGGVSFAPHTWNVPTRSLTDLLQGPAPKVLLLDGVNPVFASPASWKVADTLRRVPFIVSFGSFIDETSALADLILPDHSFLESWVDAVQESGAPTAAAVKAGPVMRPLYQTRPTPDVLLDVARKLAKPLEVPNSFEEYLNQDRAVASNEPATKAAPVPYADPQFDGDAEQYPYHLIPHASTALYDGSLAHLPWLQELPDPMTSAMWSSWIEINEKKARELGIAQGDLIEVTSTQGSLRVPAFLSPGIAPDAVAIPVGQGHTNFTRYATNRGVNPIAILAPATVGDTGQLAWAATRVKLTRVGGADESLILFGGATRERPDWAHGRGDEH